MPLVIAKTVLPDSAHFFTAIGRIFGIGRAQGLAIAEQIGVSKELRVADLKAHHVQQVVTLLNDKYKIGDELKRAVRDDILRLIEARTYRGRRHVLGLPLRGQTTGANAQTARKFKRHLLYDVK